MKTETRAGIAIGLAITILVIMWFVVDTEKHKNREAFYKSEIVKRDSIIQIYSDRAKDDSTYTAVFIKLFNEVKNK